MKVEYLQWHEIISLAVKQRGAWAVYINNGLEFNEDDNHIWKFVEEQLSEKMGDDFYGVGMGGLFFFETENEADEFYQVFNQPLTDSSPIYAVLYDNTGECLTENT